MEAELYAHKKAWQQGAIPPGWKEDTKKFTVSNVGATATSKQLTEMEDADKYIIKEIGLYMPNATDDAWFHLNEASTDNAITRFCENYYNERSFRIFDGNKNGKLNKELTSKPYLFVSAGTGSTAGTIYGSVKYYYYKA